MLNEASQVTGLPSRGSVAAACEGHARAAACEDGALEVQQRRNRGRSHHAGPSHGLVATGARCLQCMHMHGLLCCNAVAGCQKRNGAVPPWECQSSTRKPNRGMLPSAAGAAALAAAEGQEAAGEAHGLRGHVCQGRWRGWDRGEAKTAPAAHLAVHDRAEALEQRSYLPF